MTRFPSHTPRLHTPKKSFGQNFLTSIPARMAIVSSGEVSQGETILEIGPGKGFLTKALLDAGGTVLALEKDRDLLPLLSATFHEHIESSHLTLLEQDVLTFFPEKSTLASVPYKVIANIPYYITGAILSKFLTNVHQPSIMVVLVQKEVAERIVAKDKKESLLSLSVKAYGEASITYRVSKGSFHPIPKVDSAVLTIRNISRKAFNDEKHEQEFFTLIHAAFAHKRKKCISNLRNVYEHALITRLCAEEGLDDNVRAEDVTLAVWLSLSSKLSMLR